MPLKEGIVIRAISGVYTVQTNGTTINCSIRGNLKKDLRYNTSGSVGRRVTKAKRAYAYDVIAVGDRVNYAATTDGAGVIEEILPRSSHFSRAGFRGREQLLVSNLDLIFIVFACAEPRIDPWKLDRFLVGAESAEIRPTIVANKSDLVAESELEAAFGQYRRIGYPVLPTCAKTGEGIDALRGAMHGRISAFVGPSGAGKSSLLNKLQPGLNLKTANIGLVTYKGRHTTVSAELIPLGFGGWVADTPGLRDFDVIDLDRGDLVYCFPEFAPYLGKCRFDDCAHDSEPGCAITLAAESGKIEPRRIESFRALSAEMGRLKK